MPGNAIELEQLSFTYEGEGHPALRELSLAVEEGQMVVVMGATGAGKSTLAKILNRAIPAFEGGTLAGEIRILGRKLDKETVGDLAGAVGLVTQDFEAQLFATNVLQEVAFGLEQFGTPPGEIRSRARAALAAVGLADFEGRDPATLSGGEKQRLALAATLALQPRILVFDEPTTDLDPLGKLEVFDVLAGMRGRGYTLVVIEHETAAAEHADRLLIMSGGTIVADDHPRELFARPDFLDGHGVRPTDLGLIAQRLQLRPAPATLEEARALLSERVQSRGIAVAERHFARRPVRGEGPTEFQPSSQGVSSEPLVRVENVEHRYDGRRQALRGVSLSIENGEMIALIGQNGSGKTTLAKHLNGLLRPTRGRVLLRGKDVQTLPLNRVAGNVGYVFQNPDHQIFAATVEEEIGFGPKNFGLPTRVVHERTRYALDAVGLGDLGGEDPFLLSKGHRQRLAVASLLALQPELLILDEPTTGLDYDEQRRMMDLLARLNRDGMAIVIITHSPWVVAEYAERGVLMRRGELIFDGPLRRLFEHEELLESARFCPPDVTRLGRRLGFTPLSVEELVAEVA
jgi:energy-coupling factor transport system ATP-binding protein